MPSFTKKNRTEEKEEANKYVHLNGKNPQNIEDGTVPCRSATSEIIDMLRQTLKPGREMVLKEGGPFSGVPRDILVYKSKAGIMYRVMNFEGERSSWKFFLV